MSDQEFDFGLPTGYVYNEEQTLLLKAATAAPVDQSFSGTAKRMVASGVHYFNLRSYQASYLKALSSAGRLSEYQSSQRKLVDLGPDGMQFLPLGQLSGTCNGESFAETVTLSLVANYVATGTGPLPIEFTAIMPYLLGRDMSIVSRGDTGSVPAISVRGAHDVGSMPVTCGGFNKLPPNGNNSQETQMIARRDNPKIPQEWIDASAPYKSRVWSPDNEWEVADAIATLRPVQKGSQYQVNETAPGSTGISTLYKFPRNGAHATMFEGWATYKGELIGITMESWWNVLFPGSKWPHNRVVLQTDEGPKILYLGQAAFYMKQFVSLCTDLWAVDSPGTR